MRGPYRLCQCHVHNCIDRSCIDPDTGQLVPGQRLKRLLYESHQEDEKSWLLDRLEQDVVHTIASTTLMDMDMSDATVSAHQGMHSYATSDRAGLGEITSASTNSINNFIYLKIRDHF